MNPSFEEQFFVPTLRIQVTGKTKIRRLRREIYARDKDPDQEHCQDDAMGEPGLKRFCSGDLSGI